MKTNILRNVLKTPKENEKTNLEIFKKIIRKNILNMLNNNLEFWTFCLLGEKVNIVHNCSVILQNQMKLR